MTHLGAPVVEQADVAPRADRRRAGAPQLVHAAAAGADLADRKNRSGARATARVVHGTGPGKSFSCSFLLLWLFFSLLAVL